MRLSVSCVNRRRGLVLDALTAGETKCPQLFIILPKEKPKNVSEFLTTFSASSLFSDEVWLVLASRE